MARSRPDRCPGVVHPWPADDGGLVRVRLPGGRVSLPSLLSLLAVAEAYGDGRVHTTGRANLQLRGMPLDDGLLAPSALAALEATGLLPSRAHDRVRNILASPQTGLAGGRADVRPVVAELDALLLADPALAELPGRFLFTLDDGRGDLADRHRDLGLVALDADAVQLRVGEAYGDVVGLGDAAAALIELARRFMAARGSGPDAPWHIDELADPLVVPVTAELGADVRSDPLPFGQGAGGEHLAVPECGLARQMVEAWTAPAGSTLIVTPWHGVLIPSTPSSPEETS